MENAKCKICRRTGRKLFLKGEKCLSAKCPMIKKAYPPGSAGKRRGRALSEYGKELKEKQKLKEWYGLRERQFSNYVNKVLEKAHRAKTEENPAELLVKELESRLDNTVFRLGIASNRAQARQLVSHGHFSVNGKPVDIPSFSLKKGDKVSIRPNSLKKPVFEKLSVNIKKYQAPTWLKLDKEKIEGEFIGKPNLEEVAPPAEISSIFEFYSR
ncbi:30S ribosomal protein S4 [Patescibacteria group bacterium]|nr:30S ribosomal protein S4 [Patescibacteria group bacterium]MBU4162434.1 30S ribosomal protein S4 [Patescibacteria group bacterium]